MHLDGGNMDKKIELYDIKSNKFTTKTITVYLCDKLDSQRASYNSLLISVLKRGTRKMPTFTDMVIYGQELYDTKIYADVEKKGEIQVVSFTVSMVDEKFIRDSQGIFNKSVDFLHEVITDPLLENGLFKKEYVEQEKVNLCDLIDSKINDKASYASARCFEEMCKNEHYGIDIDGDKEIIKDIDNKKLYEYYKNTFLKKMMVKIFATGDLNEENIEYINKIFGYMTKEVDKLPIDTGELHPAPAQMKNIIDRMNVLQSKICMGFRTMTKAGDEDYYSLAMANMILGGGTESKLFLKIRERESMAYYIHSRIDKFKGVMIISGGIEVQNKDKVIKLIMQELEEIKIGNISDDEFGAAINSYIDAVNQLQDGQRTLSDYYLGQYLCGVTYNVEKSIEKVKAVTKESVAKAAQKIQLDTVYTLEPNN